MPGCVEVGYGDLVTIAPTCTDLAFIIVKNYQQDLGEKMRAQCEFSDGMVAKLDEQFYLTYPVTSVHKGRQTAQSLLTSQRPCRTSREKLSYNVQTRSGRTQEIGSISFKSENTRWLPNYGGRLGKL